MQPTPYEEVNRVAAELLARVTGVLGPGFGGLYLFGSAAAGAFEGGVSDVDMLVVTLESLSDTAFAALEAMQGGLARDLQEWDDRIEVLYVSAEGLKAFRTCAPRVAAISPGEPFHWRDGEPGRLMNWYDVQQNGVVLYGPPIRSFLEPISGDEFVASVRHDLERWPGWIEGLPRRTGPQSYVVLTMCRALYACQFGKQLSKTEAGVWAARERPEWAALIETALIWRRAGLGRVQGDADEATLSRIREFIDFARRVANGV
ncbi:MAG: aminoglycoside adenylyltransferase domain-containing protein [Tepidiformaceae bacterium]